MFAGTAGTEVVDHRLQRREWRGTISPDIRSVRFLLAERQHLHWRFIGMHNPPREYDLPQCIHQWLELHAGLADPLNQRRTRDRQACPAKDLFLQVQRQMISEFGHHHMRE